MKKRILFLLLSVMLLVFFSSCKKEEPVVEPEVNVVPEEPVYLTEFPQGSEICGMDVSGLQPAAAEALVNEYVSRYLLALNLDGTKLSFSAEDLKLTSSQLDFQELLKSCTAEQPLILEPADVISYDLAVAEQTLTELSAQMTPAANAKLAYSEEEQAFVLLPEGTEGQFDVGYILEEVVKAVSKLEMNIRLGGADLYLPAEFPADSETAQTALKNANDILGISMTYSFMPKDRVIGTETIDGADILPWMQIQEDGFSIELDPGPLNDYVGKMVEDYSVSNSTSVFKTTKGKEIEIRVPSPGETVDSDALYNSIVENLMNARSGSFDAPYVEDLDFAADFGGSYVEIDLTAQHLWVYKDGVRVVDTDIVTGCVNTGHATPAGVYTIKSKETDRYLVGPGYRSWVNYWMPFNGGIGLHDADGWRWSYGGSIYLYSGSHGCVNMPGNAAKTTYQNVSVGTYVILYGGTTSVTPLKQSLQGTTSYQVMEGDSPFKLDAKPVYETELVYTSDNPAVAAVAADGTVIVKGPGKAIITVTAKEKTGYTSAVMSVTVTVNSKCSLGEHQWDDGVVTTEASCNVEGVKTFTCKECSETKTEAVPKTAHVSDAGTVTVQPTCGSEGTKAFCCTVCGTLLKNEAIAPTGAHVPDAGTVTTQPTCSSEGVKTTACTGCGTVMNTEAVPVDPTRHQFSEGVCTGCGTADPNAPQPEPEPSQPDPTEAGSGTN